MFPKFDNIPKSLRWDVPVSAKERWSPIKAEDGKNVLNIYDQIGESFDGSGITSKLVQAVLRRADGEDLTVNINSPGGDFFEGVSIYHMLREYEGNVNVKVLGVAASAASVIALAGNDIKIGRVANFMIHRAWGVVMGNAKDMAETIPVFELFDETMAKLYAERTGKGESEMLAMMDKETWMNGETAVELGFADGFLASDKVEKDDTPKSFAKRQIDTMLAKAGLSRSERRELFKELGTQDAAPATHDAGDSDLIAALSEFKAAIKS